MTDKIISICKGGIRYDIPLKKQEPIADAEAVVSPGAIVSRLGHKGKVMSTEGDNATVSWEDASMSKVPINSLKFEGRVEKGGPGSGRRPEGGGEKPAGIAQATERKLKSQYKEYISSDRWKQSAKVSAGIREKNAKEESDRKDRIKSLEQEAKRIK